jgi:threonine dehydratase
LANGDVWLKLECHQPTGSFKVRGAINKLRNLSAEQRQRGIVAASAGNHALGVAYAAQVLGGIQADIFVPETAPRAKVDKIGRFNSNLHLEGQTYAEAHQIAAQFAQENGAIEIDAYNDLEVIAGQGTVGLEILTDLPQTNTIFVPVGGGGLIAGVAVAAHAINPDCNIVGVQPEASPAALFSLRDGIAYDPFDHEPTIADGVAGGFGPIPFAVARTLIHKIMLAAELDMRRAILTLLDQEQLVVEASGAISITPILRGEVDLQGGTAVCILSGANLDTTLLRDILVEFTADE